ncbi:hypothetical protein [Bradyrhizobium sp. 156]|uniref:hypothetical protein n=1 Tax=Bradyrhizobium sp. 156 TaxID=2782630 RepID=UPI001FF8CC92|nr:hypothetical protein [Bradyrhizobium sp. 156]
MGLSAGHALDAIAAEANPLLVQANTALLTGEAETAITAITRIAELAFAFYPFTPDTMPDDWQGVLRAWLLGRPLATMAVGREAETLQFVEGGLVFRLPWALEAVRVRAAAHGDMVDGHGMTDFELGHAVSAVETGTLNRSASILIQAGFNSRLAAIKAVTDTGATFGNGQELRLWLASKDVVARSARADWPTVETNAMWSEFLQTFRRSDNRTWGKRGYAAKVTWLAMPPPPGTPVQIHHDFNSHPRVLAADGAPLGTVEAALNRERVGLARAQVSRRPGNIDVLYFGPDDFNVAP